MNVRDIGIWTFQFEHVSVRSILDAAREIERLGFSSLWVPEQNGREAVSLATMLLAHTETLVVANGIARASARDARSTAAAHRTLTEAFPGRYVLGLGAANRLANAASPVAAMHAYLDAMDAATYVCPPPSEPPRLVLAAINPQMLRLAGKRTLGAHTYLCPPAHTRIAREIMGPDAYLAPEQLAVFERSADTARAIARRHLAFYLELPAYRNNLTRFGFRAGDFADGGSDRLVDTLVAWGDVNDIGARVEEHLGAGANHVCVQVLDADPAALPIPQWRRLAEALGY